MVSRRGKGKGKGPGINKVVEAARGGPTTPGRNPCGYMGMCKLMGNSESNQVTVLGRKLQQQGGCAGSSKGRPPNTRLESLCMCMLMGNCDSNQVAVFGRKLQSKESLGYGENNSLWG